MNLISASKFGGNTNRKKQKNILRGEKKSGRGILRKIKISTRLIVSFSTLVLLSVAIAILCIFCINLQNNVSSTIFEDNMVILNHLKKLSSANSNMSIYVNEIGTTKSILNNSSHAVVRARESKTNLLAYSNEYIQSVQSLMEYDSNRASFLQTLDEDDIADLYNSINMINNLIEFVQSTHFERIDKLIAESFADGSEYMKGFYMSGFSIDTTEFMDNIINNTYDFHIEQTYKSVDRINVLTNNIQLIILAFVVLAVFVSIYLATAISNSINKPLKTLIDVTNKISHGDLEVNIYDNSNDEISILNGAYEKLIESLTMLQREITTLTEHECAGLKYEPSKNSLYEGVFLDIFNHIDAMLRDEHETTEKTIACVKAIGNGDFDVHLQEFPGEKFKFNEAVEMLRKNLKGVNNEILKLIDASINGELDTRGNTDDFSGDWTKLISGLNLLMDKNIEPIDEAADALEKISHGNLKTRIVKNYNGDHARIKNELNGTIDKISMYVQDISSILSEMSNENFDLEVTNDYIGDFATIKESLNRIIDKFNMILHGINESSENILKGSQKIVESSTNLSQNAIEQSEKINDMTLKMGVVLEQTDQNTLKAKSAVDLAIDARENAAEGDSHMREMYDAMREIQESSKNISNIIKVIDDIAFQTNLLSLNAAIEAARAGAAGKGFAVVADEVRNLAGKSKKAASQTTELIEYSLETVAKGNKIYENTASSLEKIVLSVENITNIISEISSTSEDQNVNIRQINTDMTQINEINKANVQVYKEEAQYASSLEKQADSFKETVMRYKLKTM